MKKTIVFFTESMELMGGMERVIAFLANGLEDEYNVRILTMYGEECTYFHIHCPIDTLDIQVPAYGLNNKIQRYIQTITKLKIYLKGHPEIDYLVANSAAMSGTAMLVKILTDASVKMIPFEHNKFMFPGKAWRFLRRYTFKKAHRVIALTGDAHQDYLKIGSPSVHIPNAVALVTDQVATMDKKKLVAVGRLVYQKGFDILLPIWKEVVKSYPDWQLEIVGDGEDEAMLKTLATKLGINDNVIFFGQSNNIQERYLDASGFILSSRYEGFCLVMIEAMAHGLPCVSFDCESGPNEVINNGMNGYLVEDQNSVALADGIKQFIALTEEEKQTMAEHAKATSLRYSPEIIINRWKKEVLND